MNTTFKPTDCVSQIMLFLFSSSFLHSVKTAVLCKTTYLESVRHVWLATGLSLSLWDSSFSVNKRFGSQTLPRVLWFLVSRKPFSSSSEKSRSNTKTAIHYNRDPCSVIMCWERWNVVLLIWAQAVEIQLTAWGYGLCIAGFDWYRVEELGAAGEDAALRWSGDLQRGDVRGAGASPVLLSHICGSRNCEGASCRGKRALIWISLLTTSSSLSHWVKC